MNEAGQELIGRVLGGRFTLTGFIGKGAMAAVYRARQDGEPRELAVKVMHPMLGEDPTFGKRFFREAKTAARLNHPNSVRIFEYGSDSGLLFIAMELLQGRDLFDVLLKAGRFSEARAAALLVQVCDALAAAHEHGIVHRDLKPENIMLLPDPAGEGRDFVKVLDFGIAKILDKEAGAEDAPSSSPFSSAPSSALTRVGTIVGTPEYMSPEQVRAEAVDARADVYACGAMLYHLVTGRTPFTGDSPIQIALKHSTEEPTPPSELAPGLHPGLEKVILKALAKWPAQRQQSAAELARELTELLPELAGVSQRSARGAATAAAEPPSAPEISVRSPQLLGLPGDVVITSERGERRVIAHTPPAGMVLGKLTVSPADPRRATSSASVDVFGATLDLSQQKAEIDALRPADARRGEPTPIEAPSHRAKIRIDEPLAATLDMTAAKEEPSPPAKEEPPAAAPPAEEAPPATLAAPARAKGPSPATVAIALVVAAALIWLLRSLLAGR